MMRYEELATQIVVAALNAGHSYAPEKIVELYDSATGKPATLVAG